MKWKKMAVVVSTVVAKCYRLSYLRNYEALKRFD